MCEKIVRTRLQNNTVTIFNVYKRGILLKITLLNHFVEFTGLVNLSVGPEDYVTAGPAAWMRPVALTTRQKQAQRTALLLGPPLQRI